MTKFFPIFCLILLFSFNIVSAQNYSTHKVKEGETIEIISERYNLTPEDVYGLNPDAKKELKVGSVLIIPKSKEPQEPKVTIVKELDGFKNHRTKKRETLYSLSKRYNITEAEIKKYNTFLYADPLRKGDKLKIPLFKITEIVEVVDDSKKIYIVQPKEGKWRIAYKFGITVHELEALNPEMGDVLQDGQEIFVPNDEDTEEKNVDEQYSYYKVLPKEGFYRLKLKLNIEQVDLEALNPGLKESGLKKGMILKIPYNGTSESLSEILIKTNLVDSISDFGVKHIAFMLPFRLNHVNFDSNILAKKQINKDPYLNASLDFYSGVLMALDSLKTLGISLKVDVYDTKNDINEVSKIIEENDFENVDAVIGPLVAKNFEKAALDLRVNHIPMVSPIGTNLNLYENVFQSRVSDEMIREKMIKFVKSDTLLSNIIIISDYKNEIVANGLKEEFSHAELVFSRKNKEDEDAYFVVKNDIEKVLKPGNNIVFLETQNKGFVSNVTSILASLIQKENSAGHEDQIDIMLTTTNNNPAFKGEDVSNEHLSKLQFHFATTSKSFGENNSNAFVKKYEETYKVTPHKRAVRGFDLTMDVVLRLVSSDNLYMSVREAPLTEYVENKFAYKKKLLGGYYNNTVYLVKHKDLAIVEVK